MDVSVINIGNSRGIRLPKTILEQYNISDTVELVLEKEEIILRPKASPRKGWEDAFKQMHANGDDGLMIEDVFDDEVFEEWK
jgi:Growth regulator